MEIPVKIVLAFRDPSCAKPSALCIFQFLTYGQVVPRFDWIAGRLPQVCESGGLTIRICLPLLKRNATRYAEWAGKMAPGLRKSRGATPDSGRGVMRLHPTPEHIAHFDPSN